MGAAIFRVGALAEVILSTHDIFLSYARNDAETARRFADAFAQEGLAVWWDDALRAGEVFDETIEQALRAARAVVVLWSPDSVGSRWVRAEATLADNSKTFVPALIAPCTLPIVFSLAQTPDLSGWRGDRSEPAWQRFVGEVRARLSTDPGPELPRQPLSALSGPSIAVLPFANMSADPEQEYFADGISEDIITDLSKVSSLLVIARNTAFTFKGKHVDICDAARKLGVTHVLEGSVRKAGNRVRVTAQLIDGETGGHVWAERYDRELSDIFAIQDELSEAIVGALKVRLLPSEKKAIEERKTRDAEAYDFYLKARALRASMDLPNIPRSLEAYRKAIEVDPQFGLAWAGLATSLIQNMNLFPGAGITGGEIDRALERALELAPDSLDVLAGLSQRAVINFDWIALEECIDRFRRDGDGTWSIFGHLLMVVGRAGEAAEEQFRVCKADPLSLGASWALQFNLACAGRFAEAEKEYEASQTLGRFAPMEWEAFKRKFALEGRAGAMDSFRNALLAHRDLICYGDDLIATLNDPPAAAAILRRALDEGEGMDQIGLNALACCAHMVGDDDLALDAMRVSFLERKGLMLMDIWHPAHRHLRKDARFKQIVSDLGLAEFWRRSGNWGEFALPKGPDDFELKD